MLCAEARIDTAFFPSGPGSQCGLIHNDHLATPQKMTNSSGVVVWSADYKPFGEATVTVSTITNNLRFPGQYFDQETNLHYNYFRDYNPVIGRYIEKDRIGLRGGINLYAYVNNPISWIDPLGLKPGDPYTTMDGAGTNAVTDINPTSISTNTEHGGYVYKNPDGTYSYTAPVSGGPAGLTTLGPTPSTGTVVGDYHTHAAYDPNYDNENFSPTDKNGNKADNTTGYLGTPSGAVKKYDPTTGKTTTLPPGKGGCK